MSRRWPAFLALVFALALALRLSVLLELRGTVLHEVLVGDAQAFDAWGRRIAAGDWLGREVFYQAPLYPYFLGAVYALGGSIASVRVVQAVLGALGCVLVARATGELFDRRTGAAAGVLAALYAPTLWLDGLIEKSSLALFLSAFALFAYARAIASQRARWAAALGLALGALALLRENAAVLVVPFALALGARRAGRRWIALELGAFALVLAPVGLRNLALGGAFLPTAANVGVNFYLGNGAGADGLYRPLVRGRGHPEFEFEDAKRLAESEEGRALSSAGVTRHWFERAAADVAHAPARWLGLLGRKALLLVNRAEVMDAESIELHAESSAVLAALWRWANFGLLLPLAALGIARTWGARKDARAAASAAAFLGASIVLFFVVGRFRAGLVPFLAPYAGAGALALADRLRGRAPAAGLARELAFAGAALGLAFLPSGLDGDPRSVARSNLASELLRRGEFGAALEQAELAVAHDPGNADALYNRGLAAKELGRDELAEASLARAAELEPAYQAGAQRILGQMRALRGDAAGALACFERAVEADPADADARYDLGYLHETQRRFADAAEHYRRALELDPSHALARAGLERLARPPP